MAINGTTPRNSRLSTQEYTNAMINAISMPIDISIRVPSRLPVAFVEEKQVVHCNMHTKLILEPGSV